MHENGKRILDDTFEGSKKTVETTDIQITREEKNSPISLEDERERRIKQIEYEIKKVRVSKYVNVLLVPGIVFAIITFCSVGPWYDRNYGFDGSARAAFMAAIAVMIGFVVLGIAVGECVKFIKLCKINATRKSYNRLFNGIECKAQKMSSDLSNNKRLQEVADSITEAFVIEINELSRPNYKKEIFVSKRIEIVATEIRCGGVTVLNFNYGRLAELNTVIERKAVALAIMEKIADSIKKQIPVDVSGNIPSINISYEYFNSDMVEATVTYKCFNGFFKEVDKWL